MPVEISDDIRLNLGTSSTSSVGPFRRSSSICETICKEIANRKFVPKDDRDVPSLEPSYDKLQIFYVVECGHRYRKAKREYQRQFRRELHQLLAMQPNAYEAANLHRIMSYTTLWPAMYSHQEINRVQKNFFSKSDNKRLLYLMTNKIS